MSLREIVAALGGDLYDRGRRANIPAPGHSRADRSVSLLLSGGRLVVHSFGAAHWREVLDELRRRGLIDAAGGPRSCTGLAAADDAVTTGERLMAARRLWDAGLPVGPATLTARHALLRGIRRTLSGDAVFRHHPAAPLAVYRPGGAVRPAMMAAISAADGLFAGLEITYLDPSGRRAVGLRLARKTVGRRPPSSAVRIDPAAAEMLVGEGVFTTLSATERFGLPGWALLSTSNLRGWRPPPGVRRVLIAADRGLDGQRSARLLANRLSAIGCRGWIETPPPPWSDWNEAEAAGRALELSAACPRRPE